MEGLNTTILRACSIPLPSMAEQLRIATILDQANRLRRMCRYALQMCDEFLPATFVKMFGDPHRNPLKWPMNPLGDLSERITVGFVGAHGARVRVKRHSLPKIT
jgi:type I restriction enzyme, S subunit